MKNPIMRIRKGASKSDRMKEDILAWLLTTLWSLLACKSFNIHVDTFSLYIINIKEPYPSRSPSNAQLTPLHLEICKHQKLLELQRNCVGNTSVPTGWSLQFSGWIGSPSGDHMPQGIVGSVLWVCGWMPPQICPRSLHVVYTQVWQDYSA